MKPRFHGNGFIQLYLNPVTRLHIWTPEFKATRVINARIHDHRFKFVSQILYGELENVVYKVTPNMGGEYGVHRVFASKYGKAKQPELQCRADLKLLSRETLKAGENYSFGGEGAYHDTIPHGLTVSVMSKVEEDDHYDAMIVTKFGESPEHAFDPKTRPSEESLCAEIKRVLALI